LALSRHPGDHAGDAAPVVRYRLEGLTAVKKASMELKR
jgi:hypothetical protein